MGFVDDEMREERVNRQQEEERQAALRVDEEVRAFCTPENLAAIVSAVEKAVKDAFPRSLGGVRNVRVINSLMSPEVSKRPACRQVVLSALREKEPRTAAVGLLIDVYEGNELREISVTFNPPLD